MACFYCKKNTERTTTSYATNYQGIHIIIKNVPCEKCTQCGEEYLNGKTLEKIEHIIANSKSMTSKSVVIDFAKVAETNPV